MKNTIKIKLFDSTDYNYPIIEIKKEGFKEFKKILKQYQKDEEYNLDGFIVLIGNKKWFVEVIYLDFNKEVYF